MLSVQHKCTILQAIKWMIFVTVLICNGFSLYMLQSSAMMKLLLLKWKRSRRRYCIFVDLSLSYYAVYSFASVPTLPLTHLKIMWCNLALVQLSPGWQLQQSRPSLAHLLINCKQNFNNSLTIFSSVNTWCKAMKVALYSPQATKLWW